MMSTYRRLGGLALALAFTVGCGQEAAPPPPPVDAGPRPVEQMPTEEQEKALANLLHEVHVESKEEEIKCRACHAISGSTKVEVQHRCLDCHEENTSKVHAKVADDKARECLTCHDFLAEEVDPWACGGCHVDGVERPESLVALPEAPIVVIHGKEACNSCHIPHGEEPLKPGVCIECHEESAVQHEEDGKKDPEQCMTCHGGHEAAKAAKKKCATCHDGVPAKAALFEGHDACTTCHEPHGTPATARCRSCHEKQHTVGAKEFKEHARCVSCHPAHLSKTAPKRCMKCHEDTTVKNHPDDEKLGACANCHPQHEFKGALNVSRGCSGQDCHAVESETAYHSGVDCQDCHQKHDYEIESLGTDHCNSCHGSPRTGRKKNETATAILPVKGHDQCKDCHEKGAHTPKVPAKDCNQCHEDQVKLMTKGHEDCDSCHLPHEGTVEKGCLDCHQEKLVSRHKEEDTKDCATCHRSHGPEGVAEPKTCKSCHEEALPGLHSLKDHERCDDCHGFHDKSPKKGRTSCLGSCHEDQIDHEPTAMSCAGCHPFEKEQEDK